MGKKGWIIALSLVAVFILLFALRNTTPKAVQEVGATDATIYKSPTCGCCNLYSSYMSSSGFTVKLNQLDDVTPIKEKYEVPSSLSSCHTTVIEGYFIEGHVPKEAIQKLLDERPDIKGIALPGMPSASPGMPGAKTGPFVIYSVGKDGTTKEFMRI